MPTETSKYLEIEELQTHHIRLFRHFHTSPLRVKLTSSSWLRMEKRRPRPPWLEAPLSACSVEMMDFNMIPSCPTPFDARETYTKHARRCFVSPTRETTSPACHRFSISGFSERCPNSRSCDVFSECLQIVLFTLGIPEFIAVYNATADV